MLSIWSGAVRIARKMPPDSVVRLKPRDHLSDQPYSGNNRITRKRSLHCAAELGTAIGEAPKQRGKGAAAPTSECDTIHTRKGLDAAGRAFRNDDNPVSDPCPLILDNEIA
jgi:hypothetical protein